MNVTDTPLVTSRRLRYAAAALGAASLTIAAGSGVAFASPAAVTTHATVQRSCATPAPGHLACFALKVTNTVQPKAFSANTAAVIPNATPAGFGPGDLRSAYALTTAGSATQTVAIVDAQDDPSAESDLAAYRSQYGLSSCTTANGCFKKVNQNGAASPLPTPDAGWAGEISLDLDMVSAICPGCHILLVEASSATMAALGTSVNTAVSLGAKYVSNSYGGSEDSSITSSDTQYFNHPGVAVVASTGDSGYGISYPASGAHVTAVGGTSLSRNTSARGWGETAWSGAGSGCSGFIARPSFQSAITACARRSNADVSAVADPSTGVAVYQTYGAGGWNVYGGTSVSSPIIASVYALAGTPAAGDTPAAYPYSHTANLNDVTSGSNGSCSPAVLCTAGTGWDGPTGLGTPKGTAAFTAVNTSSVTVANPGSKTGTVGTALNSFTLSASGGTAPYTWTATGLPAGVTISTGGVVSGTPTVAGTVTVTAAATDSNAVTGTAAFTLTIAPKSGSCATGQKLTNPGFEFGSTGWTASAGVIGPNGPSEAAHSGTVNAWMDGYGTTHTDALSQSVTVPAGCTNSTLSFYIHVDTAETTTSTQYDKLTVKAGTTTLATYSNLNHNTGYVLATIGVGSLAGTTATISFTATEDSSLQTSFVIDDTAVNAN